MLKSHIRGRQVAPLYLYNGGIRKRVTEVPAVVVPIGLLEPGFHLPVLVAVLQKEIFNLEIVGSMQGNCLYFLALAAINPVQIWTSHKDMVKPVRFPPSFGLRVLGCGSHV